MLAVGELLRPQTYPLVSAEDENDIHLLKRREVVLDGYELVVCYNSCMYPNVRLRSIQVYGVKACYLPMHVVAKVGNSFLGRDHLYYSEVMHYQTTNLIDEYARKIYVWAQYTDHENRPIVSPFCQGVRPKSWRGLNYVQIEKGQLNFF